MDTYSNLKSNFKKLKSRIKKNEGFSITPYSDQLGYKTIGFGHLIKGNEKIFFTKKFLNNLFENDFNNALMQYSKIFKQKNHSMKEKELLIEMIYQLGPRGVLGFKKMIYHIDKGNKYMACLEMMQSLWYKQTPERVKNLIKNYLK